MLGVFALQWRPLVLPVMKNVTSRALRDVVFSPAPSAHLSSNATASFHMLQTKKKSQRQQNVAQEVSESSTLSEGENWAAALLGPNMPESGRGAAFDRLRPGDRPDTIVLRGIPANWLGDRGKAAEGTSAQVRFFYSHALPLNTIGSLGTETQQLS